MSRTLVIFALAAVSTAAHAIIVETEPNGTFATANYIGSVPSAVLPYSNTGDLNLTANDVDYLSIDLYKGSVLSVVATPLVADYTPDTQIGLFDASAGHVLLKSNDDFGDTGASAFVYRVNTTGTYFLGVSGTGTTFADGGVTGTHSQSGAYQLTVSVSPQAVPEPASMAALAVGAVALVRRRNGGKR